MFTEVLEYIDNNIFHNDSFMKLDEAKQQKAVNNAEATLYQNFRNYRKETNPMPIEAIAYQAVFITAKDSSILKAEMGVASVSLDGITQSFRKEDLSLAPEIRPLLKKRVGGYSLHRLHTHRGFNE